MVKRQVCGRSHLQSVFAGRSARLWSVYLTFFAAYAAVHLEPRYLAPVVPGSIVAGAANIAWLVTAIRSRSSAEAAPERPGDLSRPLPESDAALMRH